MERWRDIPGYDGIYQASNYGNIRTCDGKITTSVLHGIRRWKQRVLKQKCIKNSHGRVDPKVTLWKDKKPRDYLVSRLVALTWCNGYFDGATVNHIDGNPLNNREKNLEWISLKKNIQHGFETGLYSTQKACTLIGEHGEYSVFRSLSMASQYLGHHAGYLSNLKRRGDIIAHSVNGDEYVIIDAVTI